MLKFRELVSESNKFLNLDQLFIGDLTKKKFAVDHICMPPRKFYILSTHQPFNLTEKEEEHDIFEG